MPADTSDTSSAQKSSNRRIRDQAIHYAILSSDGLTDRELVKRADQITDFIQDGTVPE